MALQLLFKMDKFPVSSIATALMAIVYAIVLFRKRNVRKHSKRDAWATLPSIPTFGLEFGDLEKRKAKYAVDCENMLREGYKKFKNGLFQVATSDGNTVIVSRRFIGELKGLELRDEPKDVVSFDRRSEDIMLPEYTMISSRNDLGVHCVKADLTPNLARLMPAVVKEVEDAVEADVPLTKDWTSINIYAQLARVVSKTGGLVFIGSKLCRNEKWIEICINNTLDVYSGAFSLNKWHPWLHPIVYRFIPQLRRVKAYNDTAYHLVVPLIEAHREAEGTEGYQPPDDMLHWIYEKCDEKDRQDYKYQVGLQLVLQFASIHSTTMVSTNILYDLAAHPEYVKPLREEIISVLEENGGIYTKHALENLKKLDSFMRESQRMNPMLLTGFVRKITSDVTLSDGTFLPAGTNIEVPAQSIGRDDEYVPGGNLDSFDGFRFYNARQRSEDDTHRHQFVTVSSYAMWFGYGRHSCPGRFFASHNIKLILVNILMKYDMALPNPEAGRYKNLGLENENFVDKTKELMFRRRIAI